MIKIIACVGKNYELGKDNKLCFELKEDMKFFKKMTWHKQVLMGRKTYESIGHPLPFRVNYVATKSDIYDSVYVVSNLKLFLEANSGYLPYNEEVFVIGGASIYKQALQYADEIYLTEVDSKAEADVYFPKFDKRKYKKIVLKIGVENNIKYKIIKYKRKRRNEVKK